MSVIKKIQAIGRIQIGRILLQYRNCILYECVSSLYVASFRYHASLNHTSLFRKLIELHVTIRTEENGSRIVVLNMTIDPVRLLRLTYPKAAAKTCQRVPNRHVRSLHDLAYMLLYRYIKVSLGRACMALTR